MGWWGHGIMEGDGPSDAAFGVKLTAVAKAFPKEDDAREFIEEYDDVGYEGGLEKEDTDLMKAFVHSNLDAVVKDAMKCARQDWTWGGAANIIAAAYTLVTEYDVKVLPKKMKPMLIGAFDIEHADAVDFNSTSARRSALKRAKALIMPKLKG